jgi:hypothetical protein
MSRLGLNSDPGAGHLASRVHRSPRERPLGIGACAERSTSGQHLGAPLELLVARARCAELLARARGDRLSFCDAVPCPPGQRSALMRMPRIAFEVLAVLGDGGEAVFECGAASQHCGLHVANSDEVSRRPQRSDDHTMVRTQCARHMPPARHHSRLCGRPRSVRCSRAAGRVFGAGGGERSVRCELRAR